ncbi:MAG: outer membrane protein assembly factor BamD [Vibrionaceae bacterium]
MKKLTSSALLALTIVLAGCAKNEKIVPDTPPSKLYEEARELLDEGNWGSAILQLEALDSRYPFGAYSQQVQFDLIFAYYKNNDFGLAGASIDRFMRMNPSHPKMEWVLYMRGLNNMAQDSNILHSIFRMKRADRDPAPARQAFNDFSRLLKRYPKSNYAADAKLRMIALKNRLADYELATADFYVRREAWIAVINRCAQIQQDFPDTQAAKKSLPLMLKAYQALGLNDSAQRTAELIALNTDA